MNRELIRVGPNADQVFDVHTMKFFQFNEESREFDLQYQSLYDMTEGEMKLECGTNFSNDVFTTRLN
jgi:hypothetical protein